VNNPERNDLDTIRSLARANQGNPKDWLSFGLLLWLKRLHCQHAIHNRSNRYHGFQTTISMMYLLSKCIPTLTLLATAIHR
jgi:hypothetical protein